MTRNYELNLLVADERTGGAMRQMFERDLEGAREVHAADWAKRPLWQRAAELAVGIFDGNL
jgi:phosphatidylserine/phosphatidylglycerophosphate/cardiolipin synthase-like enzyme